MASPSNKRQKMEKSEDSTGCPPSNSESIDVKAAARDSSCISEPVDVKDGAGDSSITNESVFYTMGVPRSLLFTSLVLVLLTNDAEGVECYVCSWSPYDNSNDTCTTDYFIPDHTVVHECDKGCETVTMRDGNGVMEMFYRNCYTKNDNNYVYSKKNTRLNEEEVVKCNYKLCNGTTMLEAGLSLLVTLVTVLVFRSSTH